MGGVSSTKPAHATPPLGLDGLGTYTTCMSFDVIGNPTCDAQLLTTTRGHDVIILVAWGIGISSIIDSSGLTFTQRISYGATLSEYYARALSPLTSDNITALFLGDNFGEIQVLAIQGANTRGIFD